MNKRNILLIALVVMGVLLGCSLTSGDGDVSNDTDCITVDEIQGQQQMQRNREKVPHQPTPAPTPDLN